jgi:hypothetical protein
MAISTIALIVFFVLAGLTYCGIWAAPAILMGIVCFVVAIALAVGR